MKLNTHLKTVIYCGVCGLDDHVYELDEIEAGKHFVQNGWRILKADNRSETACRSCVATYVEHYGATASMPDGI